MKVFIIYTKYMVFLKATNDYISSIMEIYDKAKILIKELVNDTQWVKQYPGYYLFPRHLLVGLLSIAF